MKSWVLSVLAVTFLSGASTGYLVGQKHQPDEPHPTWIDQNIRQLERDGVSEEKFLEEARVVYREYHRNILAMKSTVNELLRLQLEAIANDATLRINRIREQAGVTGADQDDRK